MKTVSMVIGVLFALAVWATFASTACAQEEETAELKIDEASKAAEADILQHVPTILKIDVQIQESDPPNLVVTAIGQVPSGGWKQVQLIRRIYVKPPADGIWEYDLLAQKPSGVATTVMTPVGAKNTWKAYDTSIKGVRVYGIGRGVKEAKVP